MVLIEKDGEICRRVLEFIGEGEELKKWLLMLLKGPYSEIYFCTPFISNLEIYPGRDFLSFVKYLIGSNKKITLVTKRLDNHEELLRELFYIGVNIFTNENLHSKIILFRGTNRNTVILGSTNLTYSGFNKNLESCIITDVENIGNDALQYLLYLQAKSNKYNIK